MQNPYSVTPAAVRHAGEIAYETRVEAGLFVPGVRPLVEESWQRSLELHLDPDRIVPSFDLDDEGLREYRREHPLSLVLPVIHRLLIQHTFDTGLIIAVGDQAGRLLWIDGDRESRRTAEGMLFVEGANWSEKSVGTSAPGTALALDHGIQIGGAEHFYRIVHPWSCTAVPVHDPATGDILGVVDITGGDNAVLPTTLPLLEAAVAAAEAELRIHQLTAREHTRAAPRVITLQSPVRVVSNRPPSRARGSSAAEPQSQPSTDALQLSVLGRELGRLTSGSRVIELSARHSEILTLLAWHRHGLSAEQLADKLYSGAGANAHSVATLRAEMVRLRAVLADTQTGLQLSSRPYRLSGPLDLDAHRVLAFLERGAHRVALAAYSGPVLLGSAAPGIVEIRAEVSSNVRESLLSDGSVEVLLDYTRSDECAYDREVWVQCLQRLPARSPKRASVVARIERIDAELAR
ncbi:GAF domain-containing protein [Subtercola lobariae]|uniref:Transcriptional regulator n=1 Tax=Subtercola lobariae TaxID=1588641 RepID=A0A917BA99_9MICO|nr:GAF domain-containing protein [Subtercola lobariae]GGF34165.1 transcriptional regulator [Subtercola lobariae]